MSSIKNFYRQHYVLSNIIAVVFVSGFMLVFTMFFIDVWTNHGHTVLVPEVRRASFADAVKILDDNDLAYEISDSVYDTNLAPGVVKEVWPHPGTQVKPGRVVYLTINSFQPQRVTVSMPLTGVSSRQAMTYLESLNVKNIRIVYVPSNFPDLVEGAKYKGKSIVPGMQIPVTADVVLEVGSVTDMHESEGEEAYDTDTETDSAATDIADTPDDPGDDTHGAATAVKEPAQSSEKPEAKKPETKPEVKAVEPSEPAIFD